MSTSPSRRADLSAPVYLSTPSRRSKKGRRRRTDVVREVRLEVAGRKGQGRVPAREEAVARALRVELGALRYVEDLAADRDLEAYARVHVFGQLGLGEDPRSGLASSGRREDDGEERYR